MGRETHLSLKEGVFGAPVLDNGFSILEVKVSAGLPMWIIRFLREEGIQKASFSKYGKYYEDYIAGYSAYMKERLKYA